MKTFVVFLRPLSGDVRSADGGRVRIKSYHSKPIATDRNALSRSSSVVSSHAVMASRYRAASTIASMSS